MFVNLNLKPIWHENGPYLRFMHISGLNSGMEHLLFTIQSILDRENQALPYHVHFKKTSFPCLTYGFNIVMCNE